MINTTTTPPNPEYRTVIKSFDKSSLSEVTTKLRSGMDVVIGIWTDSNENLMESTLSGKEFYNLVSQAKYVTYYGHPLELFELGVA